MWVTETNHMGMPEPCGNRGVKRRAKLHWGISTRLLLNLLLQNFSCGSACSFLEHSLPLISLSGLICNCQPCNLLAPGQLARFSLSFEMSYFSIPGISSIYTTYLWPTFLPVIKPRKIYPDIIQNNSKREEKNKEIRSDPNTVKNQQCGFFSPVWLTGDWKNFTRIYLTKNFKKKKSNRKKTKTKPLWKAAQDRGNKCINSLRPVPA